MLEKVYAPTLINVAGVILFRAEAVVVGGLCACVCVRVRIRVRVRVRVRVNTHVQ